MVQAVAPQPVVPQEVCRECGNPIVWVEWDGPEYGHLMPHDLPHPWRHAEGPRNQGHPADPAYREVA